MAADAAINHCSAMFKEVGQTLTKSLAENLTNETKQRRKAARTGHGGPGKARGPREGGLGAPPTLLGRGREVRNIDPMEMVRRAS